MGSNSGSNSGSNDTQVSGYEREINKQKAKEKAQKEAFAKYDKSNTNPNNNTQTQKTTNVNLGGGDNNGNQVVQAPVPKVDAAPTTVEVSQVASIQAEDPIELRKRKAKAKGRSPTILTGIKGVEEGLTLGKPSLLGRA